MFGLYGVNIYIASGQGRQTPREEHHEQVLKTILHKQPSPGKEGSDIWGLKPG